jgi:hypothetical protein
VHANWFLIFAPTTRSLPAGYHRLMNPSRSSLTHLIGGAVASLLDFAAVLLCEKEKER